MRPQKSSAYHAREDILPPMAFALLDSLVKQFTIIWVDHLLMHKTLIARLIMGSEGMPSCRFVWIHTINIDLDLNPHVSVNSSMHLLTDIRCVSRSSSHVFASFIPLIVTIFRRDSISF